MANNGESSKNAAASPQKGTLVEQVQATLDTDSQPWPTPSPPTISLAMQNHRRMVYHQLEAKLITPEDQERCLTEFYVTTSDDEEQAALKRICDFFGRAHSNRPRHVSCASKKDDDNIRVSIRKGLESGRITDHDLRQFITERVVPLKDLGLTSCRALIRINEYLFHECKLPFRWTILSPDGSDPGPSATRIMTQVDADGLVDFEQLSSVKPVEGGAEADVAESHQPQNAYPEVPKTLSTVDSPDQAQKTVDHISPVKEKPDGGDGYVSPAVAEPSEPVDEDDGHGSENLTQNEEPTSCGSQTRSDTIVESDCDAHNRMTLALCKAVEQSVLAKQRIQMQLNQALLMIDQRLAKQIGEEKDQIE
ncbi:hypothetical protein FANTH_8435 [Fusarium anthophilum]|uniref:Uncharacterized protein n=1 Tax=Fusarium anthophilum TaxID=48485 RepID=A0A8H4ZBT0_9HYPO|nr:hypothetical protein FANTH_8435 [Fusarium anthophilum]